MQITSIRGAGPLAMAMVEGPQGREECSLGYLPEAELGDYVLVQNGFAMTLLDEAEARESMAVFAELGLQIPPQP